MNRNINYLKLTNYLKIQIYKNQILISLPLSLKNKKGLVSTKFGQSLPHFVMSNTAKLKLVSEGQSLNISPDKTMLAN
jgi:hypothetical protein